MRNIFWIFVSLVFLSLVGCGSYTVFQAIDDDDAKKIETIAKRSKSQLNMSNVSGDSPLVYAIREGSKNAYLALLKGGVDPNKMNYHKWCATLEAAGNADIFWLSEALKHGADPNLDNHGSSQRRTTTLLYACKDECLENVKLLIESGADKDYICGSDDALVRAASTNNFKVVLYLLESGSDFRRKTQRYVSFANTIDHMSPDRMLNKKKRESFELVIDWLKNKGVDWQKPLRDGDTWVYR